VFDRQYQIEKARYSVILDGILAYRRPSFFDLAGFLEGTTMIDHVISAILSDRTKGTQGDLIERILRRNKVQS
jgi:hypothetical protein